jgi:hypothetical protein
MSKHQKLSDLMFGQKQTLKIKDRVKLKEIYEEYLQGHFITTVNGITLYNDFEFFRDLLLFLNDRYRSEEYKEGTYWHFYHLYYEELTV